MSDETTTAAQGVYRKFNVERRNDPEGKHDNCRYFVLDLNHDAHAKPALEAYAASCEEAFPVLAADIRVWLAKGKWPF